MKYEECKSIKGRRLTAWLVEFEGGRTFVHLFHEKASVGQVVKYIKTHTSGNKFEVMVLAVGSFELKNCDGNEYYSHDSRRVNEEMEVV